MSFASLCSLAKKKKKKQYTLPDIRGVTLQLFTLKLTEVHSFVKFKRCQLSHLHTGGQPLREVGTIVRLSCFSENFSGRSP